MKYGLIILLLFATITTSNAQKLTITQFDFATSVSDRAPVGVDTSYSANVGTVFCFTQIKGTTDTTKIDHIWYYKDQEKARITLDVNSNNWRTWSSKKIRESWTGRWRVMVEDANGRVLRSKTFVINK